MSGPVVPEIELAKIWAASITAIVVAVLGFAGNLVLTLVRTGARERQLRQYEAQLKTKSELRFKLFTMQAESVLDQALKLIRVRECADDWVRFMAAAGPRTPPDFAQQFNHHLETTLAAKRAFDASGLFMPPELHEAYMKLSNTINPAMIQLGLSAEGRDVARMNHWIEVLVIETQAWTSSVLKWKSAAWQDVLNTDVAAGPPAK